MSVDFNVRGGTNPSGVRLTAILAIKRFTGMVGLIDSIIDDERRSNAFGLLMSLNMLIETAGGFDYTGADCIGWMEQAGFSGCHVEPLVGPDSRVVGFRPA